MKTIDNLVEKADYKGPLSSKQEDKIELIRNSFRNMYQVIEANDFPGCKEVEIGIERLEESQMWLIKGISHHDS